MASGYGRSLRRVLSQSVASYVGPVVYSSRSRKKQTKNSRRIFFILTPGRRPPSRVVSAHWFFGKSIRDKRRKAPLREGSAGSPPVRSPRPVPSLCATDVTPLENLAQTS